MMMNPPPPQQQQADSSSSDDEELARTRAAEPGSMSKAKAPQATAADPVATAAAAAMASLASSRAALYCKSDEARISRSCVMLGALPKARLRQTSDRAQLC